MKRPARDDLILAVDQSTSATKAVVFDAEGTAAAQAGRDHAQHYPKPGWVEHDPREIYENTRAVIADAAAQLGPRRERLRALALTNQRETVVVWDRESGEPVHNAIVWQCLRGAELCARLRAQGHEDAVRAATGLPIDPYFSASKIRWILDNVPGARRRADDGKLAFGTVDSWLTWCLTGGAVHVTDPSNASRTMLMDLAALEWDDRLFSLFGIPRSMAPVIRRSDQVVGATSAGGAVGRDIPIAGLLGDSHAAFFAQRCFRPGHVKATYGTGTSVMMNIGSTPLRSSAEVVTSVGWAAEGRVDYVLEGNIHSTGDTIRWLRDGLGLIEDAQSSEALARSVPDNNGVYLVPAFSGLGAPYWDNAARASITGMARNTTRAHIARAALEAIAYQVRDLVSAMERSSGVPLAELRVDGGATRNEFLMQFQADILNVPVIRSPVAEASALGSALMAGLAVGTWADLDEVSRLPFTASEYRAVMEEGRRTALIAGWREAVRRTLSRNEDRQRPPLP